MAAESGYLPYLDTIETIVQEKNPENGIIKPKFKVFEVEKLSLNKVNKKEVLMISKRTKKEPDLLRTNPAQLSSCIVANTENKYNLQENNSELKETCQDEFTEIEEVKEKFAPKRLSSEKLAESYARLDWIKKSNRVKYCGTALEFSHAVDSAGNVESKGHLMAANFCRDRLCPMCNWRRSYKIFGQVSQILDRCGNDYKFLFLTLTIVNVQGYELSDTIDRMQVAWRKFQREDKYKSIVKGALKTLEVTRNQEDGTYHPHYHVILAVPLSYGKKEWITHKQFLNMWRASYGDWKISQVKINAIRDRTGKEGEQAAAALNAAIRETFKYSVKDSDFLMELESETDVAVRDLAVGLKGRRLFSINGCLAKVRKELNLDDPEDGDLVHINESINPAVAYLITHYQWSAGAYKMTGTYLTESLGVD